jgi:hypothetical protein
VSYGWQFLIVILKNTKMTKTAVLIELNKKQMEREHTYSLCSEIVVVRATILVQKWTRFVVPTTIILEEMECF